MRAASGRAGAGATVVLALLWPVGVLLALLHQEVEQVTTPVFLVLDAAYVAAAVVVGRRIRLHRRGPVGVLAAAPVVLFAVAGVTGEPSGASPDLLLLNTAVLLVVALALVAAVTHLTVGRRRAPAGHRAVVTTALLLVGTTAYLVNLLGRFAVVLTGLAERQAAVEDEYWVASEYLRGLPASDEPLAYVLTWMDLVQLGYVVTAYAAAAGLARLLRSDGVVGPRLGRAVELAGWTAAALVVAAIAAALSLPHAHDAVPAALAFALTIPFMTTLLPFALAVGALHRPEEVAP